MRVSGRNNWDILNFAARGEELVRLVFPVYLVFLVCLIVGSRNQRDKTDPRTR
jgi:hypothetical protein